MTGEQQNRNIVAALSYLLFFVTGIVILLVEKDDRYIRFHAMQSAMMFGGLFIANFVISLLLSPIELLSNLINTLVWIVMIILWLTSMIKAYQGRVFKWPIVGDLAEKQVGR